MYVYPRKKPECKLPGDMPTPEWVSAVSGKRRRATVASTLVLFPKGPAPLPTEPVEEDIDGVRNSSNGSDQEDCESSFVGTDTSDPDLTNWRRSRGLPIVRNDPSSGSGHRA